MKNNKIKYDAEYSFQKYEYGWILVRTIVLDKINKKTGKNKISKKETYHTNLEQVLCKLIDNKAGDCESIKELKQFLCDIEKNIETTIRQLDI
jgi:hypothetical protein